MKRAFIITLLGGLQFIAFKVNCQTAIFEILTKYSNGELKVRLKENSLDNWKTYTSKNLTIKLEGEGLDGGVEIFQLIKPRDVLIYDTTTTEISDSFFISALINFEIAPNNFKDEIYEPGQYSLAEIDTSRNLIINYLFDKNFENTIYGAYGFKSLNALKGKNYILTVYDASTNIQIQTVNIKAENKELELPELKSLWLNKEVKLDWESRAFMASYWAFELYHSQKDSGFVKLDEQPLVNIYDHYELPLTTEIQKVVDLENNYETHAFRLYGIDHFGERSVNFREVVGHGYAGIGLAPLLKPLDQLPGNKTILNWSVLDSFQNSIAFWNVYISETYEGPYTADTLRLHRDVKSLERIIPYYYTYYKVAAVDLRGDTVFSPPQLVWSLDTIPPATPTNLTYIADTTGLLIINWTPNFEKDFLGYTLFRSRDSLGEYFTVNGDYFTQPQGIDTLYLRTNGEDMYYKVIAVDSRNNRSTFSEILKVQKPDIVPPLPILFVDATSYEGGIIIKWENSISEDAVNLSFLRRQEDTSWELVAQWNVIEGFPSIYKDSTLSALETYMYTAVVTDDAGLQSIPAQPIAAIASPKPKTLDLENFRIFIRNDREVLVVPMFPMDEVYQIYIYKRKEDQKKAKLLSVLEPGFNMEALDPFDADDREDIRYFLKVYFKDGSQSKFSKSKPRNR